MDYPREFEKTKNNLENRFQSKNFNLEWARAGSEGRRPGDQATPMPYSYGDRIVVGILPGGCNVTSCTFLVEEGFDTGTEVELDFTADFPGIALQPLLDDSTILVDESNVSVRCYMSSAGNRDSSGNNINQNDPIASVWLGTELDKRARYVVATFLGGSGELTQGKCDILLTYDRFGTNEGAY